MEKKVKKNIVNLSKNLFPVKKCPICQNKKFSKQGRVNGVHLDLKNLCNLLKCKNCKHLFLSKMPNNAFLKKLHRDGSPYVFDHKFVEHVNKKFKFDNYTFNHWIYKKMKNEKKGSYLEVGPGKCALLKTFKKNGWKCEGFELADWIKKDDLVFNVKKIKKGNKEILVFNDVLEHTPDPLFLLKRFSKFQNTGDRLFLSYPNASSFKAKILKSNWSMVAPLAHLNFFSIESTKILLQKNGYYPLVIRETSTVVFKKLLRNILRLPLTITVDLLNLRFINALNRINETFINILDLIKGDQMQVIGVKK